MKILSRFTGVQTRLGQVAYIVLVATSKHFSAT